MAILSLMARIGSADPVELRSSHDALIEGFEISRFSAAPTKFDVEDLVPMTASVVHGLEASDVDSVLQASGVPSDLRTAYWSVVCGNTATRAQAGDWWPVFAGAAKADVADDDRAFVATAFNLLGDPPYTDTTWSDWTNAVKAETGRKGRGLFMPLRLAITGQARGPEMADVMPLLQKKPALD